MNKLIIKIIFLIYISLSLSCSYEPLYSGKTYNFGIEEINFEEKGEKDANAIIENKFKLIQKVNYNKFKQYSLIIKTSKIKKIVSKDSKGDPVKFELVLIADFEVIENEKILLNKKVERKNIYDNKSDKFKYLELPKRFGNAKLPEVHLVNMIDENKATENYDTIFSQLLLDKIEDRIKKNEQVILLHNRRGFAPILRCDDCGEISKCPHCQLSLTFHKTDNVLKCHFCNFTKPPAGKCANCSSFNGRLSGTGTQKIEDELAKLFPDTVIDRLDLDAAPTAQKIFHALNKFDAYIPNRNQEFVSFMRNNDLLAGYQHWSNIELATFGVMRRLGRPELSDPSIQSMSSALKKCEFSFRSCLNEMVDHTAGWNAFDSFSD